MRAVRLCGANLMRRRWAGVVLVALLVAVGGGAVLAAAAGARRSDSAATRLYARGSVADVELNAGTASGASEPVDLARLRRIPGVAHATTAAFFALGPVHNGQLPTQPAQLNAYVAANADGTWLYDFDRIGLLPSFRGKMPRPSSLDQVVATAPQARLLHARIGTTLHLAVAQFSDPNSFTPSSFVPVTLHVVGIANTPVGLLSGGAGSETFMFGTPAFAHRFADLTVGSTVYVRLRRPGDLASFERHLSAVAPGVTFQVKPASQELETFSRVANPYTNALWIFALVAGLAAVLIVAQALIRMVRADAREFTGLRAIGTTSAQRAGVASTRAIVTVLVGAVLAVVVAVAASPLFPLGLVRNVEPDPGVRVDGTVLALGGLGIFVVLGGVVLLAARQAARAETEPIDGTLAHPSRTSAALARANAPVTVVQGTRMAFQRGAATAGFSTAASIVGLVAAVAAPAAALIFGANLAQLTTPARYGQTWDAEVIPGGSSNATPDQAQRVLVQHRLVRATTLGNFGSVKVGGQIVPAYGMVERTGHVAPAATRGRIPARDDEIAFGARTLRQLHLTVGSTVTATPDRGPPVRLHVVGETLLPSLNPNEASVGADDGALLTRRGLLRLNPDLAGEIDFLLVDLAPHVDLHQVESRLGTGAYAVTGAAPPGDIASYGDVRSTPLLLAGLIALLGIGVLVHLLVTSVRSSRRELAVLKSLGSTRGQLRSMVLWEAVMLVGAALVVGVVLGVAAGRGAWAHFAGTLDLVPDTHLPVGDLAALAGVGLVSALIIASFPARAATRTPAARVLREQ
jgi:ABC-type antimicrobial peptide transport system permease subunit